MHHQSTIIKAKGTPTLPHARLWFFLATAVLFVGAAYYSTTIQKDIRLFEQVNHYWLAAALAGQLATYTLGAFVYYTLLGLFKAQRQLNIWELFQTTIVTLFLNQTIPSAGISGNTYMFSTLARHGVPGPQILSLIFIELLTFYVAIEALILVVLALGLSTYPLPLSMSILLAIGLAVYGVFALAILFVERKKTLKTLYRKLTHLPLLKRLAGKLESTLPDMYPHKQAAGLRLLLKTHKAELAKAAALQSGIFVADAFTIYVLFQGLGSSMSFPLALAGLILTGIISLLPVSPGALILYESTMTYFYVQLDAPLSAAVIVTLLYRVLSFWLPMPFGFYIYRRFQAKEAHRP